MKAKDLISALLKHQEFEDSVAVISEDGACDGCIFKDTKRCTSVACLPHDREDGQFVIFKWKEGVSHDH